ncbi:MAG: sulfite exporter TauE/SafE family protein [Bdellovibrionaceae bacterium]|nr:sulfite exporter TauE/SafE family protein [Pseudobdellovibrionaceae bacterium]
MEPLHLVGYLGGLLMGLSLGMVGAGGSILSLPIFVYLFSIPPSLATAYSLFVVGLSALVGLINYHREGLVNYRIGFTFAAPSFAGVYLVRRYLMPNLPSEIAEFSGFTLTKDGLIMIVFAVLMVLAARAMIRKSQPTMKKNELSGMARYAVIGLEGLTVGAVTGFVGAGGGFLIIPALVLLTGLRMKEAVGTSLGVIAVKSLFGFLGDVQTQKDIDWVFLSVFFGISVVGIAVGIKLARKIPENKLKPIFGWFVLVMGAFILFQQVVLK